MLGLAFRLYLGSQTLKNETVVERMSPKNGVWPKSERLLSPLTTSPTLEARYHWSHHVGGPWNPKECKTSEFESHMRCCSHRLLLMSSVWVLTCTISQNRQLRA